jgi:7-cyano-7-deazaguanine tRNA-ribosyltransferase
MEQNPFFAKSASNGGRTGLLRLTGNELSTPLLFPVVYLITGTTARGGGLWKYVLHAHPHGLMRRQMPLMSQVLHFLDFSVRPKALRAWRKKPLREHYNQAHDYLNYQAPLFLDSGGFKLLWNSQLDLSDYSITASPESILALQQDLGGNIVATLDYPLPPGLARAEAEERMQRSRENAITTAKMLKGIANFSPLLFVAVHGQSSDDIRRYVGLVFSDMKRDGPADVSFGIAIGSLVPLRGAKKHLTIVEMVRGAIAGIPEKHRDTTPVHVFGVTGNMVPLLVYLNVDTFDSSTYAQESRSLGYFDPETHRSQPILEMERWKCDCRVCHEVDLRELQEALVTDTRHKPLPNGLYKSKYYADIALHNLEMDLRIVAETQAAVKSDALPEYLVTHAARFPTLRPAIELLTQNDDYLQRLLGQKVIAIQPPSYPTTQPPKSLAYTPDSFNILLNSYHPPDDQRILLVIPCSGGKPYSKSRSHRLIAQRLSEALGKKAALVHKVTLSGLYGPVPQEYEEDKPVLSYDFRLDPHDEAQIALVADRLAGYVERYGDHYIACVGYATSRAYRTALERAAQRTHRLRVLPTRPRTRRLTEFFRKENIRELTDTLREVKTNELEQSL